MSRSEAPPLIGRGVAAMDVIKCARMKGRRNPYLKIATMMVVVIDIEMDEEEYK